MASLGPTRAGALAYNLCVLRRFGRTMAHPFYNSHAWRKVRGEVLRRDLYQCRRCRCSVRGTGKAHVDHVVPLRVRPDLGLVMGNLQTLCQRCHNSMKQIIERNAGKAPVDDDGYPPAWR